MPAGKDPRNSELNNDDDEMLYRVYFKGFDILETEYLGQF